MRFKLWTTALSVLLLVPPNPQAWAWGDDGHCIIADIAWDHLSKTTRLNLRPFLGNSDLASVANWADDIRSEEEETGPWHYVNISPKTAGYRPSDCPEDDCVVARIRIFAHILGDPRQPFADRSQALMYLVHFVGDVSQPMHTMADARGGNDIPVTFFGAAQCGDYPCNLHSVWDSELINHTGLSEHRYVLRLDAMIAAHRLQAGPTDPIQWANSSLRLGKAAWVSPQTDIGETYYVRQRPVVDRQLALAGLRLAHILNQELGKR